MYAGTLDAASTQADWKSTFEVIDDDTGDAVDLTGATIVFELRPQTDDRSVLTQCGVALSATTANGKVTIVTTGVFQVWFLRSDMQTLAAGYYDVGCVITLNGETTQFIAGAVPVVDGVVSQ